MVSLFLFAHQDDEFGVFHEIATTIARGERAVCVYLTNGAWRDVSPARRNAESTEVLRRLGIPNHEIHFLGTDIGIPGSALVESLDRCWDALILRVAQIGKIDRVIMHAWEGGHHDHDAAHLLGVAIAARCHVVEASRQFPLYRAPGGRFRVAFAAPLPANGLVSRSPIPWATRFANLARLRFYRSQLRTLVKLMPWMALDYLTDGCQKLQPVSLSRITEPPNSGPMLYETWKLYTSERFNWHAAAFIAGHCELGGAGSAAP